MNNKLISAAFSYKIERSLIAPLVGKVAPIQRSEHRRRLWRRRGPGRAVIKHHLDLHVVLVRHRGARAGTDVSVSLSAASRGHRQSGGGRSAGVVGGEATEDEGTRAVAGGSEDERHVKPREALGGGPGGGEAGEAASAPGGEGRGGEVKGGDGGPGGRSTKDGLPRRGRRASAPSDVAAVLLGIGGGGGGRGRRGRAGGGGA